MQRYEDQCEEVNTTHQPDALVSAQIIFIDSHH